MHLTLHNWGGSEGRGGEERERKRKKEGRKEERREEGRKKRERKSVVFTHNSVFLTHVQNFPQINLSVLKVTVKETT